MRILAIDPGTRCGWAVWEDGTIVAAGTWDLGARRHEGGGMRFLRLARYLEEALCGVGAVAYEEVRRHLGVDAAHIYGGIVATLSSACEARGVPYTGVPVATVKKLATGKGNADKARMIAAANARWGIELRPEDENEADARWIAETAAEMLAPAQEAQDAAPAPRGGRPGEGARTSGPGNAPAPLPVEMAAVRPTGEA